MNTGFLILFIFIGGGNAFQMWDGFRITWCYDPKVDPQHCFQKIPRSESEAVSLGWHEIKSDCVNRGKFYGRRFIKGSDIAISVLLDINGILAGVQMNLLKSELLKNKNPYKFSEVPEYLDNEIDGKPVYSLTYYFVKPSSINICVTGRTKNKLNVEGTGTGLWIQKGPRPLPRYLIQVPLYRDTAIKEGWSDNLCVNTMGYHNYYRADLMSESACLKIQPAFLLYNTAGELIGVGATAVGNMTSSKSFEHPDRAATKTGLGDMTPECMMNLSEHPGYSNMHMHFIDDPRSIKCTPLIQTPSNGNPFEKQSSTTKPTPDTTLNTCSI